MVHVIHDYNVGNTAYRDKHMGIRNVIILKKVLYLHHDYNFDIHSVFRNKIRMIYTNYCDNNNCYI